MYFLVFHPYNAIPYPVNFSMSHIDFHVMPSDIEQ